jgi:1-deoxy-D-xylulose-5-phosphate reductoisomerase
MKTLSILGSTGSIGTQALECVARYPDSLGISAFACGSRTDRLAEQIRKFKPQIVSVRGPEEAKRLKILIGDLKNPPEIVHGPDGLIKAATWPGTTSVLNALVGAVGLSPTLAALRANLEVLLANKESLVMAGSIIQKLLKDGHGSLVPVDSEHSAIFQCIGGDISRLKEVSRLILTASGGPFREMEINEFASITVKQALLHPTWKMGPKITIDSATLVNKGLEIIEAHYLFGIAPEKIDVLIHPASIVHSFVEFHDGSMLAQMSYPTMQIPIQYALLGGERKPANVSPLDLAREGKLEFFKPDSLKFPALDLARRALKLGGTATCVLNAANEEAVRLFLEGKINFPSITSLIESALDHHDVMETTENTIMNADLWARNHVFKNVSEIFQYYPDTK